MSYTTMDGTLTTANDPLRFVWYGVGCTFWTDDTSKLSSVNDIPCCPKCGCVGFQAIAKDFINEAALDACEQKGNPGYKAAFFWGKEKCFKDMAAVITAHKQEEEG